MADLTFTILKGGMITAAAFGKLPGMTLLTKVTTRLLIFFK